MSSPAVPKQRKEYISRACGECKKRKIRCSGDAPCHGCRGSPRRVCRYNADGRSARQRHRAPPNRCAGIGTRSTKISGAEPTPTLDIDPDPVLWTSHMGSAVVSARYSPNQDSATDTVETLLCPNQSLNGFLQCYFDELETFYPCFDRIEYYQRLSGMFVSHTTCWSGKTFLPKRIECLSLAAMTCDMACLGAYLGGGRTDKRLLDDFYTAEAYKWHQESRRLRDLIPLWREQPNLDLLRLHLLEVIYMIILQRPGGVSENLAVVVDLAFALKLHNEELWHSLTFHQREYNRLLWWTICFIDRRVALKIGRPILIRAADYAVGVPTTESQSEWARNTDDDDDDDVSMCAGDDELLLLNWRKPSDRSQSWFSYVVFTARWSHLVAWTWDEFFSPQSFREAQAVTEHIALTDVLLLQLRDELPTSLLWDAVQLPELLQLGDLDRNFRMRLIILEAINTFRIQIRLPISENTQQSILASTAFMPSADQQPLRIIDDLASDLIDAVTTYMATRKSVRPWSTYGCILLKEVATQLLPLLQRLVIPPQCCSDGQRRVVSSMVTAQRRLDGIDVKHAVQASNQLSIFLQRAMIPLC